MAEHATTDRRQLLRLAAAGASTLWWPRAAWCQPRLADNPFALGVASGSPTDDSVVLWTRITSGGEPWPDDQPVTVRWEVAHDEAFSRIARKGQAQALAELAHSVHVEPGGLEADRWYFYRFMLGDFVSPVGRTRTFPAPDALPQRLRLAYASCQRWEHGHYAAWRHLLQEGPDLVLFLGDYLYEYPASRRGVRRPPGLWVTSLDDYRRRHALYKSDEHLQAMHAACPWLVTWDDHEVQNDYAGLRRGSGGPPFTDFAARRAAAYQAYYEHMPLRASVLARALQGGRGAASLTLHSHQRYGRLARLLMLDTRQHKDPQACTPRGRNGAGVVDPAGCEAWHDPRRSLLGVAQEQWLDARLAQPADTGWTLIGQSTLFGRRDLRAGPGEAFFNDGWDGYPAARKRFTQSLKRHRVGNAVLFGGDVHENWVGQVKADYDRPDSDAVAVEFCGTSISSRSSGAERVAERMAENPHFIFADALHRGYGLADVTPARMSVHLRGLHDVEDPGSGIDTLARFVVEAGRPRVERA
jgi:alkaline phosphatase D